LIGFALAGGGTSWSLSQGLGGGQSDVFQAGLYGSQKFEPWYVSGAVAFANYWASTSRMVTLPSVETLNAGFTAQSWGGRAEAGYLIAWAPVNLAPYVALQAQSFSTPNYSETATSGSNQFALSYASRTGSVVRSELGSWASKNFLVADNALVTAFGRRLGTRLARRPAGQRDVPRACPRRELCGRRRQARGRSRGHDRRRRDPHGERLGPDGQVRR
jgi:outer membrane autotransporter protein